MTDRSLIATKPTWFAAARLAPPQSELRMLAPVFAGLAAWLLLATILKNTIHGIDGATATLTPAYYGYAIRNSTLFFEGVLIIGLLKLALQIHQDGLAGLTDRLWSRHHKTLTAAPVMFVAGVASFGVLMSSYTTVKVRIPSVIPFAWDNTFASLDAALFFGTDPWKVFGWIYEIPALLRTVDFLYDLWAVLLVGSWITCFVAGGIDPARRLRYCLSLMMTWFIGGNLIALLFSSAGPCFYEHVGADPARYSELMTHLRTLPDLRAPGMQDMLWQTFEQDGLGIGGISALPSMHCATAFLYILMFGRTRVWRMVTSAYFLVILFGSVILGWHYLVDGLAGAAVAFACWKLSRLIVARVYPAEKN
nr:phosphatase PAP2 family protein [uncultured Hyphomonas sp.]